MLFACLVLHHNNHRVSRLSSISLLFTSGTLFRCTDIHCYESRRCSVRITSIMRSYTWIISASASGPGLIFFTVLKDILLALRLVHRQIALPLDVANRLRRLGPLADERTICLIHVVDLLSANPLNPSRSVLVSAQL